MKVLHIHQYFATPRAATGTRSYELSLAMKAAGHEVTMLASTAQLRPDEIPPGRGMIRRGQIAGFNVIVLDVPYQQRMSYARRILSFLQFMFLACWVVMTEPKPDLIYPSSTPLTVGIPALLAKFFHSVPYAFEVLDLWPEVPVALGVIKRPAVIRALKFLEETLYRNARFIVAANDDFARYIRRMTHGRKEIIVVPNACDVDLFRPDIPDQGFRRRHGLEGKILCVHTGAMGPVNGLHAIIDAAEAMRDDDRIRFVLIGEGNVKESLVERVEKDKLPNVLILDAVPKVELAGVLATADIGLMTVAPIPILEWNCANKFFDYLSSGLPVALNYEGWQGRILVEHDCGLPVAQGDTDAFIRVIRRLADDAGLRSRMGANARSLACTGLNRQNVIAPLLAALERGATQA